VPLESLATVDIQNGQISVVEDDEDEDELRRQQEELDLLVDADGRLNLDFTIDSPRPLSEDSAEAAAAEAMSEMREGD